MPVIKRRLKQTVGSTFAEVETDHITYVRPERVQPKDVVLAQEKLSDAMLGDLFIRHPREFGVEHARRLKEVRALEDGEEKDLRILKLQPTFADAEDVDESDVQDENDDVPEEDEGFQPTATQEDYLTLSEQKAIERVRAEENIDTIAELLDAEESSGKKRPKVLKEFARKQG